MNECNSEPTEQIEDFPQHPEETVEIVRSV